MYEDYKIYGPYKRKDNRMHICMVSKLDGSRKTVSYPKYLMEVHLKRYLLEDETVDHIDCNFENNELSNLRILKRSEHTKIDCKRIIGQNFTCIICNKEFVLSSKKLSKAIHNRKQGKSGPFCSKSCAGMYGSMIQNEICEKINSDQIIAEYTKLKYHV